MARAANKSDALATSLRALRARTGLKSSEVARQVGMDVTTLSRLENGRQKPSTEYAVRLAAFYGVTVDELLGRPA